MMQSLRHDVEKCNNYSNCYIVVVRGTGTSEREMLSRRKVAKFIYGLKVTYKINKYDLDYL